ncbi:MAG: S8 family serine peptidase [Clostridiales bacterium]|nr:S8 family serine peptidase [Clostridiales bacterium]
MKKTRVSLFIFALFAITIFAFGLTASGQSIGVPSSTPDMLYTKAEGYVPGQLLVGMEYAIPLSTSDNTPNSAPFALFPDVEIVSIRDLTDVSDILPDSVSGGNNPVATNEFNTYNGRQILLVELDSNSETDMLEAIRVLEENPLVAYAEFNFIGSAYTLPRKEPNDPGFPMLWGMDKIMAPEAWYLCTGSDWNSQENSYEVMVGVMDTGVDYTHPDLGNVDLVRGRNFCPGENYLDPMDDYGHGTHVSGTIGAVGDNDEGVVGVSWEVTIVPLKIWKYGYGSEAELIRAIVYSECISIPILNLSGGWVSASHIFDPQAMKDAVEAYSGLLVASAGNFGNDNDNLESPFTSYPASLDCDNIISVAASYYDDELCGFSSYGAETVDLAAPGDNIWSTVPYWYNLWSYYDYMGGTSMAAPHVAGTAALVKAYGLELGKSLSTADIKEAILDSVDHSAYLEELVLTEGRLNTYEALKHVDPPFVTLTYDANGGIGAPPPQMEDSGIVSISMLEPERNGCDFLGWATSPDLTNPIYPPGGTIEIYSDTTLYAVWQGIMEVYPIGIDGNEEQFFVGFDLCLVEPELGNYSIHSDLIIYHGLSVATLNTFFDIETGGSVLLPFVLDDNVDFAIGPHFQYLLNVDIININTSQPAYSFSYDNRY